MDYGLQTPRPKTVKLLGENIGGNLWDLGLAMNDFLFMTQKAWATKANTDKWSYIILITFMWDILGGPVKIDTALSLHHVGHGFDPW